MLLRSQVCVLPRRSWRRNLFGLRWGVLWNRGQVDLPHIGLLILEHKRAQWDVGVRLILLLFLLFLLLIAVALLRAMPVLSMLELHSLLLRLVPLLRVHRLSRGTVRRPPSRIL